MKEEPSGRLRLRSTYLLTYRVVKILTLILELIKTLIPKFHHSTLPFHCYRGDHRLCVVLRLRNYIERTNALNFNVDSGSMFICYSKLNRE